MADQAEPKGSTAIKELIARAISDPEFKDLVLTCPEKAAKDYNLSEVQLMMLKTLTREDLDKLTPENLEEYFSADAAVYTPDEGQAIEDFTDADEDDI